MNIEGLRALMDAALEVEGLEPHQVPRGGRGGPDAPRFEARRSR